MRVRVVHRSSFFFGWETDQFGGPVTWSCDALLRTGWTLSGPSGSIVAGRARAETEQGGSAVPFDGAFDWGGASGGHEARVVTTASSWASIPLPAGPLTLATRGASEWTIGISAPFVPTSGGSVTWLNATTWSAEVEWAFEG